LKALFAPATSVVTAPAPRGSTALGEQEARAIAEFSRHFGITFQNPQLLKLALTHRSYLSVTGQGPRESNERLEFLGDSVLGLVTSEYLYRQHPNEHEGQLTKTKSLLVSKAILSRRALAMGLGRFVLMSHSEVESGGRQRLSIIADAFESVVGAIYLDQGFEAGRTFIERWLLRDSREIAADKRHTNYKSHLQEYVQSTFRTHPVYRIRSEMGPDHSKQFMVEVMVGKRTLGEGKGRNKKEAEQAAARDALERVQHAVTGGREGSRSREDEADETHEVEEVRMPREEPRVRERSESFVAPPVVTTPASFAEAEPESESRTRSRRGRRGGRGRTGFGETDVREVRETTRPAAPIDPLVEKEIPVRPAVEAQAPVAPEPRRVRPERRPEPPRVMEEPELQLPEIEPLPPAYEEDENEEVGRPEGPLEERHIDPFAVEPDAEFEVMPEEPRDQTEWEPADEVRPPSRAPRSGRSSRSPSPRSSAESSARQPVEIEPPEPPAVIREFVDEEAHEILAGGSDDEAESADAAPSSEERQARPEKAQAPQFGRRGSRTRRGR
jgi:ribonuclease III